MINWPQIVNNALSTLVAAIVVAACVIVWKGATSVDGKIDHAIKKLEAVIEIMQKEFIEVRSQNREMAIFIEAFSEMRFEELAGLEAIEDFQEVPGDPTPEPEPMSEPPPERLRRRKLTPPDFKKRFTVPEKDYIQQMMPQSSR